MLKSQKNVFWEALLIAGVIFVFGMLLGAGFERNRVNEMNEYYINSEISLMDILALSDTMEIKNMDCNSLISSNIKFANRIYEESVLLEKYESAEKVGGELESIHKKYDLLRTFLWMNNMKIRDRCGKNFSTIVYLYEYGPEDLAKKATQNVWSKVLLDLKEERGDEIILIPIAANINLTSLDALTNKFKISNLPVVVINDKHFIYELSSSKELEEYLD